MVCANIAIHIKHIYRWVPLKPDFLGAWKSVWLISILAYLHQIIQEKGKTKFWQKIWAKQESGLTTVWLKQDQTVFKNSNHIVNCSYILVFLRQSTCYVITLNTHQWYKISVNEILESHKTSALWWSTNWHITHTTSWTPRN